MPIVDEKPIKGLRVPKAQHDDGKRGFTSRARDAINIAPHAYAPVSERPPDRPSPPKTKLAASDNPGSSPPPQTFQATDTPHFRLDPNTHADIFTDIQAHALSTTRPSPHPVAILLGGQPGAGKAALSRRALDDLGNNAVKIDADDLRAYHPEYLNLMRQNDRTAADLTHGDAGPWAVKLTTAAMSARRSLVIDGTMRDPDNLAKLCRKLRDSGYRIEARVLAVNDLVSRLSIHERYERQVIANGFGRWSNRDKHDQAFIGVPLTVEKLEGEALVDRMTVYARNGRPLYDNHLLDGEWSQRPPAARLHIEAERHRAWTPAERQHYDRQLASVLDKMLARGASPTDIADLNDLRRRYEEAHKPTDPRDTSRTVLRRSHRPKP